MTPSWSLSLRSETLFPENPDIGVLELEGRIALRMSYFGLLVVNLIDMQY